MDVVGLLKDLIAIPSINPMGRAVTGPEFLETRLTSFLLDYLRGHGLECETHDVAPGRTNIVSRLPEVSHPITVLLDAHQDTVPVEGMTIPPFRPDVSGDQLFGRGSCDVKGGMAAMITAFLQLAQAPATHRPNVVLTLTVDEEATSLGVNHLTRSWVEGGTPYRLLPTRPTVAIVAEPTMLNAVVAHRGATRWRISTAGRACHSSRPQDGVNAIYRMAKLISALEEYAQLLPTLRPAHHLCGTSTLSVGLITGGSSVNVVPDGCVIDIDRRVIPGEDCNQVVPDVVAFLKGKVDFPFTCEAPFLSSPPLSDAINGNWADRLLEAVLPIDGPKQKMGVAYGTHASRFEQAGIPAVVIGPGDIAQAHTKDEFISIDQLQKAVNVYRTFCLSATP
jgi:succinyl-diaminopimelate desuccinylase